MDDVCVNVLQNIRNCPCGIFTHLFSVFYDRDLLCAVWNDWKYPVSWKCRENSPVSDRIIGVPHMGFHIDTYTLSDVFTPYLAGKGNCGRFYPPIVNVPVLPDLSE